MGRARLDKLKVGAIVAALSLGVPSAASGLKIREADGSTVVDGLLTVTAHCKQDERVISGGFNSPPNTYVLASHAKGSRGWTVTVYAGATPLTTFAYCGNGQGVSVHSRTKNVVAAGDYQGTATPRCDSGESVVSGGYATVDPDQSNTELIAFESHRAGSNSWKISVVNNAGDAKFKAYAYCQNDSALKERSHGEPIGGGANGDAVSQCHKGEQLVSGGYSTSPETDFFNGPDLFYYSSHWIGRRSWDAAAKNPPVGGGTITAIAYCKQ